MAWLKRLHPQGRRAAPGLEWRLLRRMPRILVVGTLLPIMAVVIARALSLDDGGRELGAALSLLDIYAIGVVILHWTLVLTLSIGCFIVMVMKGPAYVADAYPLPDADRPLP